MGFRFGQDRYSEHRYSWLTEWVSKRCEAKGWVVPMPCPPMPLEEPLNGHVDASAGARQAQYQWGRNQQRMGVRPQR